MELFSSKLSTNFYHNQKIATENEFQNINNKKRAKRKINNINNIIKDTNKNKEEKEIKDIEDNKYNDFILKTEISKNENRLNTQGNNQVSFNCNCIGKYSYKNTEAITIINNNTNENNIINTFYTERKSINKTDLTNNKICNSKIKKNNINNENFSINDKKTKNSTISKNKTNKTINSNRNNTNNILEQKNNESEKEKLCLDLEILNSWNLPIGLQLHLDQYGLKNSIRNEKDSITYFGFQTEEELNTNPCIDYLLGPKDQEYDEQFIGKHFQIRFDWYTKKYYIKDLGNGFGTFIKLINEEKIKDNLLINIGETYIVFSFNNENEKELMIKIFTGDEQCNSYLFNMDNQTCIIIGRDSSLCDVIVEDKMLSRIHCCINYKDNGKNEKGWYIKDGNMEGKKSTNDTWFYSAEETLIYDKMIFKTNHILFKCIYK